MFDTLKHLLFVALLIGAGICFVPGPATAALITLTTADGDGADSYVRGGSGIDSGSGAAYRVTNYGSRDISQIKFIPAGTGSGGLNIDYDNSFTRAAYLRFDISGVTGPITDATLSFNMRATELGNSVPVVFNTITDGHAQDAAPGAGGWREDTLTMENSGLLTDPTGLIQAINSSGFSLPSTPGPTIGPIVNWTHSNLVPRLNADTNGLVTFVIIGAPLLSGRGANFWTKENLEGTLIPTLSLTVEDQVAITAPGAVFLLCVGAAGIASHRRRTKQRNS